MICPYCSTDMEPIELGGKTFCSNCGLTISSATPQEISNHTINNFGQSNSPSATPEPEIIKDSPAIKETHIPNENREPVIESTEEVKVEAQKSEEEIPNNTVDIPANNVDEGSLENSEEQMATTIQSTLSTEKEKFISDLASQNEPAYPDPSIAPAEKKPEILMNILNNTDEVRTLDKNELKPIEKDDNFSEDVEKINQLGTAGILLDILSDEAVKKESEIENKALEASNELIDKLNFDSRSTPQANGAEKFEPENGKKIPVDVLDNSPVNPILHPEIEAAPAEIDLPLPNIAAATDTIPEIESESALESTLSKEKEKSIEDIFGNNTENNNILSEEETNSTENIQNTEKNIDEFIQEELDPIPLSKEVKKEIKKELQKLPDENEVKEPEVEVNYISESTKEDKSNKSDHLKNYFSHIIVNKEKKTEEAKKPTKKHKKSKKDKKKNLKIFVYIFIAILFIVAFGTFVYFYRTNTNNTNISTEIASENTTAASLPTEIPYGYKKGQTTFDEAAQTYRTIYSFSADETRTITLSEKTVSEEEAKTELENFNASQSKSFEIKKNNEIEYTIFEGGNSISWINKGKLFTITKEGETYKELLVKMAFSVE